MWLAQTGHVDLVSDDDGRHRADKDVDPVRGVDIGVVAGVRRLDDEGVSARVFRRQAHRLESRADSERHEPARQE